VVASGTPEQIAGARQSYTGRYLRDYMAREGDRKKLKRA
jgi:excinuclease UvrABC ATPase subunit